MSAGDSLVYEKRFQRRIGSLPDIFLFIDEYFDSRGIDRSHLPVILLAAEEMFTNLVKYGSKTDGDILIGIDTREGRLAVALTDFDADRFDINELPEVRVDAPITERKPGGLGIHLVRNLVDRVDYEYSDRTSRTTIIKNLE